MSTMLGQGRASPNEEKWRHKKHWDSGEELVIVVPATSYNLGPVVPADLMRRLREITVRTTTTQNIIVRVLVNTTCRLSFDVTAQSTRIWSSQDGREFQAGDQLAIRVPVITGGTVYLTAGGLDAWP